MAIRNWNHIQFWTSIWLGDFALVLRFSSLYIVCRNPNAKILEMETWNENSWKWSLSWRKSLWESKKVKKEEGFL